MGPVSSAPADKRYRYLWDTYYLITESVGQQVPGWEVGQRRSSGKVGPTISIVKSGTPAGKLIRIFLWDCYTR